MGAQFAAVGDLEAEEVLVFRLSGIERFTEDFRLPEMDRFDIPAPKKGELAVNAS